MKSSTSFFADTNDDDDAVAAERLRMFCSQSVLIPFGVAVLCGYIVYMLWAHHRHEDLIAWAVATWIALATRAALAGALTKRLLDRQQVDRWTSRMITICFLNGVLGGAAGFLFFAESPLAERALLTMLLCCWSAGAMATSGSVPKAFYAFLFPFLAPITVSWLYADTYGSNYTALLIVFFAGYEIVFVRDNATVLVRSVTASNRSKALAAELDIKHREADSARSRAEEANQAKSRFLAAASHDLRQPMYALSLYSASLRNAATEDGVRQLSRDIDESVQALNGLFDGLIDVSRLDSGTVIPKWQSCVPGGVFDQVMREHLPAARNKRLALTVELDLVPVRTDPILLGRIVTNLVQNAIRYTDAGEVRVHASHDEDWLAVRVSDTGIGIPREERERIFEEFYQVDNPERDRARGTGLGLAIVRRLVGLLECRLEFDSEVGKGSTFTLFIPRSADSHTESPPATTLAPRPSRDLTGMVVLIIDDERAVRRAAADLLTSWGCAAVPVASRQEALDAIDNCSGDIDLIIADYRLSGGEDGIDVLRHLRTRLGDVPAMLITGDTAPNRLAEAEASGFPVLHKPVTAEVLRLHIEQVRAMR